MYSSQVSEASYELEDRDQKLSPFEKENYHEDEEEDMEECLPDAHPVDRRWRLLFGFTSRRQYWLLAISLAFTLVSGLILPATSIILGNLFEQFAKYATHTITTDEFTRQISRYSLGLTVLGFLCWWINGTFFTLWLCFGEAQARNARETVFGNLLKKKMAWFETHKDEASSSLVSRCQRYKICISHPCSYAKIDCSYIRDLQMATSQPLGGAIKGLVTAIGSLCVALYYSWSLALVILAGVPVAFIIVNLISTRLQNHIDVQSKNLSHASKTASRAVTSITIIKAHNNQSQEAISYTKSIHRAAEGYRGLVHNNALQLGFTRFIVLSMFVQGFWYGSKLVRQGQSPGRVMTTFWSSLMAAQAIEQILPSLILFEKGRAAAAELKNILASESIPMRDSTYIDLPRISYKPSICHGYIYLEDVRTSFHTRIVNSKCVAEFIRFLSHILHKQTNPFSEM